MQGGERRARARMAVALVALSAPAPLAAAEAEAEAGRFTRPGVAVLAGVGNEYAGLGLQLRYLLPVGDGLLSLAPNLGAGFIPGIFGDDRALDDAATRVAGLSAGISASLGRRHRLTVDLGYGIVNGAGLYLEGILVDAVAVYGPFLHTGYEFAATSGFFVRLCPLGAGYTRSSVIPAERRLTWAGSLGLGWKLW